MSCGRGRVTIGGVFDQITFDLVTFDIEEQERETQDSRTYIVEPESRTVLVPED